MNLVNPSLPLDIPMVDASACDALRAEVEPFMSDAMEFMRERRLARQPWAASLTTRMRSLEGRMTGDYGRGYPRFQHFHLEGVTLRSPMQHAWPAS